MRNDTITVCNGKQQKYGENLLAFGLFAASIGAAIILTNGGTYRATNENARAFVGDVQTVLLNNLD